MFISFPSAVVALSLLSPFVSAGHMDKNRLPAHHNVFGRGLSTNDTETNVGLARRAFSGHSTWYKVGLGACGQHNVPSDFIVALNSAQYGGGYPGPNCFKTITINAKGKSAQATIMDECPTCPYGCLDFSEGLFKYFGDLGEGMFDITWSFGGGGGSSGGSNDDDNDDEERERKERQSRSSVSEKSTASVESVSRESRAELSSRSAASVRSEESEASRASLSSVSAFSVTSVAAIPTSTSSEFVSTSVADADLPAETHTTSSSSESTFKAATISNNNLGLSLQILKQFGNLAVIGA